MIAFVIWPLLIVAWYGISLPWPGWVFATGLVAILGAEIAILRKTRQW